MVFGSSQLGGDKELMQKLKLGTVDLALPSTVMSSESDLFGIFEMPYLVKDRKHMQAIEKAVFWSQLAPEAEKKGLKVLAVWENGYRHITNNKHPIVKPAGPEGHQAARAGRQVAREDVPGLRREPEPDEVLGGVHRAADRRDGRPGEPVLADRLRQVPGSPEVPVADRPRLHAGLPHGRLEEMGARFPPTCARCWKPPPRTCRRYVYAIAEKDDNELIDKIKAAGVKVNEADKAAFVAASKPVYEEFGKEVKGSKELIDQALALGK